MTPLERALAQVELALNNALEVNHPGEPDFELTALPLEERMKIVTVLRDARDDAIVAAKDAVLLVADLTRLIDVGEREPEPANG